MSNELLGDDFRLFYDSASAPVGQNFPGDWSNPTWIEVISIGDLGLDYAIEQVEIPIRIGTKVYKSGRADWAMTFVANYNIGETFFDALMVILSSKDPMHLAIADGPSIATANYWEAWWNVTGNLNGALDSAGNMDCEAKVDHYRGAADDELPRFVTAP